MSNPLIPVLILLALAPGASADQSSLDGVEVAQVTLHQRIIIRIPRLSRTPTPVETTPRPQRWNEKKGPKCVPMGDIDGAVVSAPDSIDLMMEGDRRIRAKLDDRCPPMDFYSGFYMKPTPDGMICAERDAIRSRSGGACPIAAFKRLEARR
jgi:hypothetical protein